MSNAVKNLDILSINLNVLHNYFASLTKLFSIVNRAKFLDTLTKLSSPRMSWNQNLKN